MKYEFVHIIGQIVSRRKRIAFAILFVVPLIVFLVRGGQTLFKDPYCTVLKSDSGEILSVRIAGDMQWRFPASDTLPERYIQALRYYEDEYFYRHPGVNPFSLFRALRQNIRARKVVSGGSTLTMQTVRLAVKTNERTIWNKLIEMAHAFRLELWHTKVEILTMYATHAPMGGNIVGLEAASHRYFNRGPHQISWAEAAMLAVLPNAPSLIFPGKNTQLLLNKRNKLLDKLLRKGVIDAQTCELAKDEPVPDALYKFPHAAPHLLDRVIAEKQGGRIIRSSLDASLQSEVNRVARKFHERLHQNEIHNLAIVVLRVRDGRVLAYCGNSDCNLEGSGKDVDVIRSPRSPGSALKPFLYEAAWRNGGLLPEMLVPDIPTYIGGFAPMNFDEQFDGAVPADKALARSLNIPAVRILRDYGVERFYGDLTTMGLSTLHKGADHYGLSLILGGAEVRLDELTLAYLNLSRTLRQLPAFATMNYLSDSNVLSETQAVPFDRGSVWWLTQALGELNRPAEESGWEYFQSTQKVAWKTGTSHGFRDAWAVGYTPEYAIGVWVGNADGEGRPGLTGVQVAAPVFFEVLQLLQSGPWFQEPFGKLKVVRVCAESGKLAGPICTRISSKRYPLQAERGPVCNYHVQVHLDQSGQERVHGGCYPQALMQHETYFSLPAVMEWYYRRKNPMYRVPPPFRPGCETEERGGLRFIYPRPNSRIRIPINLDGSHSRSIAEIAIKHPERTVYWHLDGRYLGSTTSEHKMELIAGSGKHLLSVVDEAGEQADVLFYIE